MSGFRLRFCHKLILQISQFQAQSVMLYQILSRREYLIPTYNIIMVLLHSHLMKKPSLFDGLVKCNKYSVVAYFGANMHRCNVFVNRNSFVLNKQNSMVCLYKVMCAILAPLDAYVSNSI